MKAWGRYSGIVGGRKYYSASVGAISGQSGITNVSVLSSTVWPVANLAIYLPIVVEVPTLVKQLWCLNGAATAGNVDMGLYTNDGTKLVSIGTTPQSGTTALQAFDITDTYIGPGLYYVALALSDGTTATINGQTLGSAELGRVMGLAEQTTAFALPSTATFATFTRLVNPTCGFVGDTVI